MKETYEQWKNQFFTKKSFGTDKVLYVDNLTGALTSEEEVKRLYNSISKY